MFLARAQADGRGLRTVAGVELIELGGMAARPAVGARRHPDYASPSFCWHSRIFRAANLLTRRRHAHNMPDFLVFAALPARLFGRPVIDDVHDLMPELYHEKFGVGEGGRMLWALRLQERWAALFRLGRAHSSRVASARFWRRAEFQGKRSLSHEPAGRACVQGEPGPAGDARRQPFHSRVSRDTGPAAGARRCC